MILEALKPRLLLSSRQKEKHIMRDSHLNPLPLIQPVLPPIQNISAMFVMAAAWLGGEQISHLQIMGVVASRPQC